MSPVIRAVRPGHRVGDGAMLPGTRRLVTTLRQLVLLVVAVSWAMAVGGCKKQADDDEGVHEATGGTGFDDSGNPACEPLGAFRCNSSVPEQLEVCDPTTRAGWRYVETCGSAELCDAELGRCQTCEPGSFRCDAWRLQACAADGSGWSLLNECESAELCDSRNVQCAECLPGSGYCDGQMLLSCNRTQDGFTRRDCGSKDNCSVTSMSCRRCIPGEYQCSLEKLEVCTDARTWEEVDSCETPQLCELTYQKLLADPSAAPECEAAACEPGEYTCGEGDGRQLFGCPPSQAEWQLLQVCDTADRCNAESGQCDDGPCLPGERQCDGIALQVCSSSGTAWETVKTCASEEQCNVNAGDCVACDPGDVQCSGRLLQDCSEDREWVTRQSCASASLCTLNAADPAESFCAPPECGQPGEAYRCDQEELQICGADLVWEPAQQCASAALCNAMDGRCNPPGCQAKGYHRCQNNILEVCPGDLTGWTIVEECAVGTTCDLSTLSCTEECPETPYRCNGALPEHCVEHSDGSIEWQVASAPCATQGLCWASEDGAGCNLPVCGGFLSDYRCNPEDPSLVERCATGRTGWELALTCMDGSFCDPGPDSDGPGQCDICNPNDFSCDDGELTQCDPAGQSSRFLEHCGNASRCVDPADGSQGYCLRCDEGQTQCNGTNLDTCSDNRRGWVPAEECDPASGCHDNPGSSDYCNVCSVPGETQCEDSSTLRTCTPEQDKWDTSQDCAFGCQDDRFSDYCRECTPNSAQCSTSSSTRRRVCSDMGLWQDFNTCPGGSECFEAGDADYCGSCEPGSTLCVTSTQLQTCGTDGRPGPTTDCDGATPLCLGASNSCVECSPGSAECTPSGRRTCGADGTWTATNCASGQVCLEGSCVECAPGAERCTGSIGGGREVCSASGVWETRNCTSAASAFCFEGRCSECGSSSGPRCTGSNLSEREVCVDGDWTSADCAADEVCIAGECEECDPSAGAECTGPAGSAGRRICQGGDWVDMDCAGATPVCVGGDCRCEPDATRCSAASGKRQRCAGGVWVDDDCESGVCVDGACAQCASDDDCPSAYFPLCEFGTCVCDVGDERCVGAAHQLCMPAASGNQWTADTCPAATPVCSNDACVCSDGSTRCQDGTLQTCIMGAFTDSPGTDCTICTDNDDCEAPAAPICSDGVCAPCSTVPDNCVDSVCVLGICAECSATNITHCEPGQVCSSGGVCVPCSSGNPCGAGLFCVGGSCQVGDCESDEQRCDEGGVHQICTDGAWQDDPCDNPQPVCGSGGVCEPCTASSQCDGGVCSQGSCTAAECSDNETRCAGADYQVCDAGTWTEQACTDATPVCDPAVGCVECVGNDDCDLATPICFDRSCVECESGTERCAGTAHELCVAGAWATAPCDSGQVCDISSGTCVDDVSGDGGGSSGGAGPDQEE